MRRKVNWIWEQDGENCEELGAKLGVHPALIRIAANRGIKTEEELQKYFHPKWRDLNDATLLKNAGQAAELLEQMIRKGEKIRIIGDYDIDGICSTVILYECLFACHAKVDYQLPHRIEDGYGLNEKLIRRAKEDGCDAILTCDNGIAAIEEIRLAKELGLRVIVTDHHEPVQIYREDGTKEMRLPPADIVVDPKQEGETYPFTGICGAVVAWQVMRILCKNMDVPQKGRLPFALEYIDLAAIATIGDVMELVGENRAIVSLGLSYIRSTRRVGLRALIVQNQLQLMQIRAYHVGFVLGPCMNASGRLDTAGRAVELLLEKDERRAGQLAAELVALNESRKHMTDLGVKEAMTQVEEQGLYRDDQPVLVVYLPDCHESLAGIIAGKLREQYFRPAFVLTKGESCVKGSGRSIPAYDMHEKMSRISDMFLKFGGHKGAAGLSIEESRIDEFRRRINEDAGLSKDDLTEEIRIDVDLTPAQVTLSLVDSLELLEPFGNGNEKPRFALRNLTVKNVRRIGKDGKMLKFLFQKGTETVDALFFGNADELLDDYREKYGQEQVDAMMNNRENQVCFSVIGYPQEDDYGREPHAQLVIKNYQ